LSGWIGVVAGMDEHGRAIPLSALKEQDIPEIKEEIRRQKSFIARVREFASVVTGPKVDETVFEKRLAICSTCPALVQANDKEYCGACSCPNWNLSELHVKLWFAKLECPLEKFTKEPEK